MPAAFAKVSATAKAVCVAEGGALLYMHAEGFTEAGGVPVTVDNSAFLIASITKTFIAVMCLQCVDRGEIDLDANIDNYLSRRSIKVSHPTYPDIPITVRHLLTHSSGLFDDESSLERGPWRVSDSDFPLSLEKYVLDRLSKDATAPHRWNNSSKPGARYHYSNAGFTLLAFVLECATSTSLSELATRYIFVPLGLRNTSFMLRDMKSKPDVHICMPHF